LVIQKPEKHWLKQARRYNRSLENSIEFETRARGKTWLNPTSTLTSTSTSTLNLPSYRLLCYLPILIIFEASNPKE
jgi:hypothetical protein